MCLILDTNRFGDVLSETTKEEYKPLLLWLTDPYGDGAVVLGGSKYRGELGKHRKAIDFFVKLSQAGRLREVDDKAVNAEAARIEKAKACESDDEHVIALARVSGARVVCTEDQDLFEDVKDKGLLDKPRGRVYRDASHKKLLHHDSKCQVPVPGKRKRKRA